MFRCGELMFFVGNCDWSVRLATLRLLIPRPWDCASANGIAQMARSESRTSALRRRCALMEGLICFFIFRAEGFWGISGNNPRACCSRVYDHCLVRLHI